LKEKHFIFLVLFAVFFQVNGQTADSADFRWGNGFYYNLNVGESVTFKQVEVKLLKVENHYNQLKIGEDTLWLKVARRSLPEELRGIRVFVADNKHVKALASGEQVHGLLTKDALVCISELNGPLLDPDRYTFPVSFNDGFVWNADEESYPFSLYKSDERQAQVTYRSFPGVGFDLHDARGLPKHWLVAIENSRVVWVENMPEVRSGSASCVLLESESQPGIYYVYSGLFSRNLLVKRGQKLMAGDPVGTAWGDDSWGHVQVAVVHSQDVPNFPECFHYAVNGFPQIYGLYFQFGTNATRFYSRGRITFGFPRQVSGNRKNVQAYESYTGKGWLLGKWCPADKVEWVVSGTDGNARLKKVLFEGTPAQCKNPQNYFDYQIVVRNGTYRIRARVGDLYLPSWQKIEFEGVASVTKSLNAGETDWTGERVVKVNDGTLNVRMYIDSENKRVAGLSEIVFQRAY